MPRTNLDTGLQELQTQMKQVGLRVENSLSKTLKAVETKQNITYIIRAANRKTFREIHHEIRGAQVEDVAKALAGFKALRWFLFLPAFLIRFFFWVFWWMLERYPQLGKKYGGTVGLTAVGMFGEGAGWGIPPGTPKLNITVGGIGVKPGVVDGCNRYLIAWLSPTEHARICDCG